MSSAATPSMRRRRRTPAGLDHHREDWREVPLVTIDPVDAKDHDDAVYARRDTDPEEPRRLRHRRRHRRRRALCDARARRSTARRSPAATPSTSPTASCRCCRSASPTTCARSSPASTAPAIAVRMVIGADGRKREHRFHRVLMRSCAKLHYAQAQAAVDGRARRHHRAAARARHRAALRGLRRTQAGPRRARVRSISICPSARSCSSPTTPSTG